MDDSTLPEPFAALAVLADGKVTLDQAAALTDALNAVPDLQRWLRQQRRRVVSELRTDTDHRPAHSREEVAARIGTSVQRVSDIIGGHSRQAGPRRTVKPSD